MAPAKDRALKMPARWFGLTLAMTLGAADPGCSRLKSERREPTPTTLGTEPGVRDIYAEAHRERTLAAQKKKASAVETPVIEGGAEVGMAIRPASTSENGVALRAPVDSAAEKLASPSTGVPNASLLLASTERRPSAPTSPKIDAAQIVAGARAAIDAMQGYEVVMHRQERVNGTLQPEEDVILAVRRQPRSVRLAWPVGPHKGREVLYRSDEPGGLMHVNMADSAIPVPRLSIPPNSPMVLRNSRHPITEAGFDSLIEGMEEALRTTGDGLVYRGLETPPPLDHPHHCLVRTLTSGDIHRIYVDPRTSLPTFFAADTANGELLERYVFRDIQANPPALLSADAFSPAARWGPPRGLFGRVARGNSDAKADPTPR